LFFVPTTTGEQSTKKKEAVIFGKVEGPQNQKKNSTMFVFLLGKGPEARSTKKMPHVGNREGGREPQRLLSGYGCVARWNMGSIWGEGGGSRTAWDPDRSLSAPGGCVSKRRDKKGKKRSKFETGTRAGEKIKSKRKSEKRVEGTIGGGCNAGFFRREERGKLGQRSRRKSTGVFGCS